MKLHRVFIAINLPERVKEKLLSYQKKWPELPARWTSKENLHLTLMFLGNTSDAELRKLIEIAQRVGERHEPFELQITRIQYGPDAKRPRMIWAIGGESPELFALQKDITTSVNSLEAQRFSSHLTLARLKMFELQRMELDELPDINEEISLDFQVKSMEIMESKLKRSGAEYTILQSMAFKGYNQ